MVENGDNQEPTLEQGNEIAEMHEDAEQTRKAGKRKEFSRLIKAIYGANGGPVDPEILRPYNADDFKEACEYLGREILSEKLLRSVLDEMFEDRHEYLKQAYRHGSTCLLLVSPATESGNDLSDDAIEHEDYFHYVCVHEDGTTQLFSSFLRQGPYASVFPKKIQEECAFKVEWNVGSNGETSNMVSSDEFIKFHNNFVDSFNCLRAFFGLDKFDTKDLYLDEDSYLSKSSLKNAS